MSGKKLVRRLEKRLHDLLQRQAWLVRACRREGRPEHIHELRTSLRRLRVMLDVAAPWLDRKAVRACLEFTQTLTRATCRLRDLDVATELLSGEPAPAAAVATLHRRRHRLWLRRRPDFRRPPAAFFGLVTLDWRRRHSDSLARRHVRKLELSRRALLDLTGCFNDLTPAEQHAFRRAARRLRYLRELGLARRKQADDPVCRALAGVQNAIGGRLDWAICRSLLPGESPPPAPEPLSQMNKAVAGLVSVLTRWQPAQS